MNVESFHARPHDSSHPELLADVHRCWMQAMYRGDFAEAWRQTDRIEIPRRQAERAGNFTWQPHHLLWNGESFEGRRVMIRCNHGLGDTLQFLRFVPLISSQAAQLTLMTQPSLVRLLQGHPGFGSVRNGWTDEPGNDHDMEIEIMELAYALRVTETSLPKECPYIKHDHIHQRARPLNIGVNGGILRVGLLWAASDWDPTRSIPIELLEPLFRIPGIKFYSLQQGPAAVDIHRANLPIVPLHVRTTDIVDAAAALLRLDLFITVDSMSAHLAGSLGRPVWLLLRQDPDWRWMRDRTDSPWYPTMRLFRQRGGDWPPVIREICDALPHDHFRSLAAAGR